MIIECKKCKSLIHIKKAALYRCPGCKTALSVVVDQTVTF